MAGAHSRACGMLPHEHGGACHSNCPTCGGRSSFSGWFAPETAQDRAEIARERDRLILEEVLTFHTRTGIEGCHCGWAEPGRSWPAHVANVYFQAKESR